MSDYVGFLYRFGVAQEKHIIRMPAYGKKGWYKSIISVGAFRDREAAYFLKSLSDEPIRFSLQRLSEWEESNKITAESMQAVCGIQNYVHPYDNLPCTVHNSVFDFYAAVGYDYKKKRYI